MSKSQRTTPTGGRILVADDKPRNRELLCQYVAQLGHSATPADNGRTALSLLLSQPFDLVLLDVLMPEMDGYAALEQIKANERTSEIPVIMISGLDEVDSVVRCIQHGAEDYLSKPFDPVLLRARISACLEKKRLRDEELRRARELERTLQQLKTAQDQLLVQEKMASLGVLTAGIAHEIRNPLNFVTNFAELAGQQLEELRADLANLPAPNPAQWPEVEELLTHLALNVAKIGEHGRRANQIVASMLLHARSGPGQLQQTDLNALVAESVHLAYHGFRGQDASLHLELETAYDVSMSPVWVFPQELRRVFLNLAHNACYAIREKMRMAVPGQRPRLAVRTRDLGDRVEVRLRDNGVGIPAAHLEKIFQPFFTTKPAGVGTGLGLSIAYDIVVQMHQGSIRVESEEGAYAEFIVTLPKRTP